MEIQKNVSKLTKKGCFLTKYIYFNLVLRLLYNLLTLLTPVDQTQKKTAQFSLVNLFMQNFCLSKTTSFINVYIYK